MTVPSEVPGLPTVRWPAWKIQSHSVSGTVSFAAKGGLSLSSVASRVRRTGIVGDVSTQTFAELVQRAAIGPIPGAWMLVGGLLFNGCWIVFALVTLYVDRAKRAPGSPRVAMG